MGSKILAAVASLFVIVPRASGADLYEFTEIYSLPDMPFVIAPAINSAGAVAFSDGNDNDASIFVGSGGPVTLITAFGSLSILSINDSGTVAFGASGGIVTGNGGAVQTVLATGQPAPPRFSNTSAPAINNAGDVVFGAYFDSGDNMNVGPRIYKGSEVIAQWEDEFFQFDSVISNPVINDAGVAAYSPTHEGRPFPQVIQTTEGRTIASVGGQFTALSGPLGINNNGEVSFFAELANGQFGVYVGDGATLREIARTGEAFIGEFRGGAIDAAGNVAFLAELRTGGTGIFTGPNVCADKVLQTGDWLPTHIDQQVVGLEFGREGFNDVGQLAIHATFADGTRGILRASPIPPPGGFPALIHLKYDATFNNASVKNAVRQIVQDKLDRIFAEAGLTVFVTDDPSYADVADRTVQLKDSHDPLGRKAFGRWVEQEGSYRDDGIFVYQKTFYEYWSGVFTSDAALANGYGETAAHEVLHSYRVDHDKFTPNSLMAPGEEVDPQALRALGIRCTSSLSLREFLRFNTKVEAENLGSAAAGTGDVKIVGADNGTPSIPALFATNAPPFQVVESLPYLDSGLTVTGPQKTLFDFGFLTKDSSGQFRFVMKRAAVLNPLVTSPTVLTMFDDEIVQWALHGAKGTAREGGVFPAGEFAAIEFSDPVFNESLGQTVFRMARLDWDIDHDSSIDLVVTLDADAFSPGGQGGFQPAAVAAAPGNFAVSELMYHPAVPSQSESNAGFTSADDFEFVELLNTGAETIDLAGVSITNAVMFNFNNAPPAARRLLPGARLVVVGNQAAFLARYPSANALVAGEFSGSFGDDGGTLAVLASGGGTIASFAYGDSDSWPADADGGGASLVLDTVGADPGLGANWHPSAAIGGAPGADDHTPAPANPLGDDNGNGIPNLLEYATGPSSPGLTIENYTPPGGSIGDYLYFRFRRNLSAGASYVAEQSDNLANWTATSFVYVSTARQPNGTAIITYRSPFPLSELPVKMFLRLRVSHP